LWTEIGGSRVRSLTWRKHLRSQEVERQLDRMACRPPSMRRAFCGPCMIPALNR